MKPSEAEFARALAMALERVERTYGITTHRTSDMLPGISGDLDGQAIYLATDLPDEPALFAVLHLFGHCSQWSSSARAREIGRSPVADPSDEELQELFDYELEAHDIGLQLLHEIGEGSLESWYDAESRSDLISLMRFYMKSGTTPFDESLPDFGIRAPIPKRVPVFTPTNVGRRELGGRVIDFRHNP